MREYPVSDLCSALSVSASGYYAWLQGKNDKRLKADQRLEKVVKEIFNEFKQRYGAPRIHAELRARGEQCSRKRIARLMRKNGLQAKAKRKFKATTDSNHKQPIAENLLKQHFKVTQPNLAWVADMTYVRSSEGWLYLAVVIDLYSRRVVGWAMDKQMKKELVINAYLMAYWKRKPKFGLLHHSDRGSQYASRRFQATLKSTRAMCSMSSAGCCYDNAVAESFFHSMKTELARNRQYLTREEAKKDIFEYIEIFYNRKRRHSTINYCTPMDYEEQYEQEKVA